MPTRKIKDIEPRSSRFNTCSHPDHEPPTMMVYLPGEYEHECAGCGRKMRFNIFPTYTLQTPHNPSVRVEQVPEGRKIFYVDVKNIPPGDIPDYVERVRETIQASKCTDEDFFIPTRSVG